VMINSGKRRYQRFIVEKLGIYAKTVYVEETELLNISMTGACVAAKESLRPSDKHLIKLLGKGKPLTLPCQVIWEKASPEEKEPWPEATAVYRAGVEFEVSSSDKLVVLKDFIRVSGVPNDQVERDEYQPSALRFKVYTNEKALLYYPRVSPVKVLGRGGMLIESDKGLEVDRIFPMALFLPRADLPIKFQGRIACSLEMPDKKSRHAHVGIEFLGLTQEDESRLTAFLETLMVIPIREKLSRLFRKIFFLQEKPRRAG